MRERGHELKLTLDILELVTKSRNKMVTAVFKGSSFEDSCRREPKLFSDVVNNNQKRVLRF